MEEQALAMSRDRGHTIIDLPEGYICAPGVIAVCSYCTATVRVYQGRICGEAYLTWCPKGENDADRLRIR